MNQQLAESRQRVLDLLNAETDLIEENYHLFQPDDLEEANNQDQLFLFLMSIIRLYDDTQKPKGTSSRKPTTPRLQLIR
jgi:hypothetical protein